MWFISHHHRPLKYLLWTVPCKCLFLFSGYKGILDDHLSFTFNRCLRPAEAGSDTNPLLSGGLGGGCSAHLLMKYHRSWFSHTDTIYRAKIWDQIFCFSYMSLSTPMYSTPFGQCSACRLSPSFPSSMPDLYLREICVPGPESAFSSSSRAGVVPREVHWGLHLWIFLVDAD